MNNVDLDLNGLNFTFRKVKIQAKEDDYTKLISKNEKILEDIDKISTTADLAINKKVKDKRQKPKRE